jgi:hypothetical protein
MDFAVAGTTRRAAARGAATGKDQFLLVEEGIAWGEESGGNKTNEPVQWQPAVL